MRVWRLSVAYIGPKSRTERPRKIKIGTEVGHYEEALYQVYGPLRHTWLGHHFQGQKVKGQLAGGGVYCGGLPHSLSGSVVDLGRIYPDQPTVESRCWGFIAFDKHS